MTSKEDRKYLINTETSQLFTQNLYMDSNIFFPLAKNLPLTKKPPIFLYGRTVHMQRSVGFFSDDSIGYKYSQQIAKSQPLTSWMKDLLIKVNDDLGTSFNGILVNRYEDGSEYIGPHSDDERSLSNGTVAAISLGSSRTFRVRSKKDKTRIDLETKDGQLLVMSGKFQQEYTHEIPKCAKGNLRISLTFRQHTE